MTVLATVLFAANVFWRIVALPMWSDEVRTWRDGVGKPYGLILTWQHNADHAPLGHLLTKASSDLFRTQAPWALRLPSFLFGVACVPLAYLLGRLAWDRRAGAIMAVMSAVDVTLSTQAQYTRMYTMFLAWTLAALCAATWALRADAPPADAPSWGRGKQAAVLGLCLAGALWSHYAATATLVSLLLLGVGLLVRRPDRSAGLTLLAGVAVALLLSTQGLVKLAGMAHREPFAYEHDRDVAEQLLRAFATLSGNAPLCVALFVAAMGGLVLLVRGRPGVGLMLVIMTTLGVVNLFVASKYRRIEGARYLVGFLPACWLGLAVINDRLWASPRRWLAGGCVALFVLGTGYQFVRVVRPSIASQAEPLRQAAATLRTLGYTTDQPFVFAPVEPLRTTALYYGLRQSSGLQTRLFDAMKAGTAGRRTLGGGRPAVLWLFVVTPCRPAKARGIDDGLAQAQAAAAAFGQRLDAARLPTEWEDRDISIVRLTPASIDCWAADGTPRPQPTDSTPAATRPAPPRRSPKHPTTRRKKPARPAAVAAVTVTAAAAAAADASR